MKTFDSLTILRLYSLYNNPTHQQRVAACGRNRRKEITQWLHVIAWTQGLEWWREVHSVLYQVRSISSSAWVSRWRWQTHRHRPTLIIRLHLPVIFRQSNVTFCNTYSAIQPWKRFIHWQYYVSKVSTTIRLINSFWLHIEEEIREWKKTT